MRVTTNKKIGIFTGEVLEHTWYEYSGPVDRLCSSGDSTVEATEKSQAAFSKTLQSAFSQAWAEKMPILKNLQSTLENAIQNPKGFQPKQLALMKTQAADTTAVQTAQAQKAANAYVAAHGGAAGSGVAAQIGGQIAAGGAQQLAATESGIDIENAKLQSENYWRGIAGLTNVAQAYDPYGASSGANAAAGTVANLSMADLAHQQAGWQQAGGIISGAAGIASMGLTGFGVGGFGKK